MVRNACLVLALLLLGTTACGSAGRVDENGGSDADSDSDVDADADTDTDADSDADSDSATDSDSDSETASDSETDSDTASDGCAESCSQFTHCEGGTCVCDDFFTDCGGACVRLGTHANCSSCEDACDEDWVCDRGSCRAPCPKGCAAWEACCGDRCIDVQSDPNNCGSCENECGEGDTCSGGVCYDWG